MNIETGAEGPNWPVPQHRAGQDDGLGTFETVPEGVAFRQREALNQSLREVPKATLGAIVERTDIQIVLPPDKSPPTTFKTLPNYKTEYPQVVVEALCDLYTEYNKAFAPLVEANREHPNDYRYCFSKDGTPINYFVQVDMVGLPQKFLEAANGMTREEVKEVLRGKIFEIENSLACYQLLERIFESNEASPSLFKQRFRDSLESLSTAHSKPIALLAVTDQKYEAMRESEFGKVGTDSLSDAEVKKLSGFDKFFGPAEFKEYLERNNGKCEFLLYVRSSDPVDKLKHPDLAVENPLLSDPNMRAVIKENSITFNIDAPNMPQANRINDTKGYLVSMGMGVKVQAETDIYSPELAFHLQRQKPYGEFKGSEWVSQKFAAYLVSQGIEVTDIEDGAVHLRAKPLQGTYGCYGHIRGGLPDRDFRRELRVNLKSRGDYLIQPEIDPAKVVNETDGHQYSYIDRNFLSFTNGKAEFICGFRSLMNSESHEAKNGRVHGSSATIWAEIVAAPKQDLN